MYVSKEHTVLQQIVPLVLTPLTIRHREALVAPLLVLPVALFRQAARHVPECVAPSDPGVGGEGVACF